MRSKKTGALLVVLCLASAALVWWTLSTGRPTHSHADHTVRPREVPAAKVETPENGDSSPDEELKPSEISLSQVAVVNRPIEVREYGYVGSESCQKCHADQYRTWHASYHRTMTQLPSPQSVVGTFDLSLAFGGKKYFMRRRGDEFWVKNELVSRGGEPQVAWKQVVLTTGSHHLQAYWLDSGHTRALDLFPFIYRIDQQRWIPLSSVFLHPPDVKGDHPRGAWNRTCIQCHTTHGRPRIHHINHMDTSVAELAISCEACHGPAEQHVKNAESDRDELAVVHPASLSPRRSAEVCGQCHSSFDVKTEQDGQFWIAHGFPYRPGDRLTKHRRLIESGDNQFWSDGLIRVTGREYNGLLVSPCYDHNEQTRQLTCLSCHEMHQAEDDPRPVKEWANDQLKLAMDSNRPGLHNDQACTQCHQQYADHDRLTGHTHHDLESTGSRCYNCHMPHTTWGVMRAVRSHNVSSPNVKESLRPVGRPNACNLCHLDKTLAWTASHLHQRYDQPIPELSSDQQTYAASVLWTLTGDAGQRALIAWNMGWDEAREVSGDDWMAPLLAQLLVDPYHMVRATASNSLQKIEGFGSLDYDYLGPPDQRKTAILQVLNNWTEQPRVAEQAHAVLIDPRGELQWDALLRLMRQRDNRRVQLEE